MTRGAADRIEIKTHETGPRPFIALAIPSFGMVHLYFAARLFGLRMPMHRIVRHFYVVGKEVGDARNEIVALALDVEQRDPSLRCSHVFFLDDDVLFHPDVLLKLLEHRRPIVSGLYYAKTSVPTPLVLHGDYEGTAYEWTPGELVECAGHGMGLTLIEADVFRRLRDETDLGTDSSANPAWFTTTKDAILVEPGRGKFINFNQTEDMAFLGRAKALGYQPAVDTSPQTFGWHLDTAKQTAYPQKQWKEFCETGRISWQTKDGTVVWENAA